MRYPLKSYFHAWKEPFSGQHIVKFSLYSQACVGNFDSIPPWKVVGGLYLDSSYDTFKYFAILRVGASLNCSVMCKPP